MLDTAKDEKIFKSYNLSKLSEFKRDLRRDDVLAVETTTNTRYFVEEIRGCVKEVKVINTTQFKVISKSRQAASGQACCLPLAAYFGIVPRVSNSNETVRHGRITKPGNKLGRTTLVQCTLVAIKYSEYLRTFYLKIKGKKGSGKAIIAATKKLSGVIYHTLKNKWVFEDFSNFVIKAA